MSRRFEVRDMSYILHLRLQHLCVVCNEVEGIAMADCTCQADDYESTFFRPAVRGTLNALTAARECGTVERVVIATSAAILRSFHGDQGVSSGKMGGTLHFVDVADNIWTAQDVVADSEGPFSDFFTAYQFSKVKAWHACQKWLAENKVGFDVIQIYPSFVLGKNPAETNLQTLATSGSSSFLIAMLLGSKIGTPIIGATVHLDDTAQLFLRALDQNVAGGQHWIANSQKPNEKFEWNDARDIVRRKFPKAVESGLLSLEGDLPTAEGVGRLDNSGPENALEGFKFQSFEEQVVAVVEQLLELQ
jgi:nucleoside-diphosphate-sugar epimerase